MPSHATPDAPLRDAVPTVGDAPLPDLDGRQSEAALAIQRGAARLLRALGYGALPEVGLANGRRADLVGIDASGMIMIVEIKSSLEDFRADQKWPEYRDYCDRLCFAVAADFPVAVLPTDAGLILADRYGGEMVREAPLHLLSGGRRKAMLVRLARLGALRWQSIADPDCGTPT